MIEGDSRMSSVFCLNARPSIAIVFSESEPRTFCIFFAARSFCFSFVSIVVSTMFRVSPLSLAIFAIALVSFGKQEPP
jgi:hypothetical protein